MRSLFILPLLLLSACTGLLRNEEALRVSLASLQVLQIRPLEQRFSAEVRIQNRTRSPLEVEGLTFDLALNGKAFASGVSSHKVTIDALSEAVVPVTLTSSLSGVIRQLRALDSLDGKPFRYTFSGVLYTASSPFGMAFSDGGEIDLLPAKP